MKEDLSSSRSEYEDATFSAGSDSEVDEHAAEIKAATNRRKKKKQVRKVPLRPFQAAPK